MTKASNLAHGRSLAIIRAWHQIPHSTRTMIRIATVCLLVYWSALFILTHVPGKALPRMQGADKSYHLLAFAGLSFLLCWALPRRHSKRLATNGEVTKNRQAWLQHLTLAAVIAIGYACLDELTQKFIPGRSCDVWDVVADVFGICLGLVSYQLLRAILQEFRWGRSLIKTLSR